MTYYKYFYVSGEDELNECLQLLIQEQMQQCGDVLSTTLYSTRIRYFLYQI